MKLRLLIAVIVLAILGGAGWGVRRIIQVATASTAATIPTTHVKKGRVTITVSARGELQGGNSEVLTAPMTGGQDMAVTYLRDTGEVVNPGSAIVTIVDLSDKPGAKEKAPVTKLAVAQ